jgi:hypothetical protein
MFPARIFAQLSRFRSTFALAQTRVTASSCAVTPVKLHTQFREHGHEIRPPPQQIGTHPVGARNKALEVSGVLQDLGLAKIATHPLYRRAELLTRLVRVASESADLASSGLKHLGYVLANRAAGSDQQDCLPCPRQSRATVICKGIGGYQNEGGGQRSREDFRAWHQSRARCND